MRRNHGSCFLLQWRPSGKRELIWLKQTTSSSVIYPPASAFPSLQLLEMQNTTSGTTGNKKAVKNKRRTTYAGKKSFHAAVKTANRNSDVHTQRRAKEKYDV